MAGGTAEVAYHGTLAASTADTVCIINPWPTLTIVNRGASEIFFTVGTSVNPPTAASVGTANNFIIPGVTGAAVTFNVPQEVNTPPKGTVVSLVSSGTPSYSVEAI